MTKQVFLRWVGYLIVPVWLSIFATFLSWGWLLADCPKDPTINSLCLCCSLFLFGLVAAAIYGEGNEKQRKQDFQQLANWFSLYRIIKPKQITKSIPFKPPFTAPK